MGRSGGALKVASVDSPKDSSQTEERAHASVALV